MQTHLCATAVVVMLGLLVWSGPGAEGRSICAGKHKKKTLRILTINPPQLFDASKLGFAHIRVHRRTRVAHVAGMSALNKDLHVVGKTLKKQLEKVSENIRFALDAVHSDYKDIISINSFLVASQRTHTDFRTFRTLADKLGNPPDTLVYVPGLSVPGLVVEVQMSVALTRKSMQKLFC